MDLYLKLLFLVGSLTKQFRDLKVIGEEGVQDLTNVPADFIVSELDQNFLSQYKCPDSFLNIKESDLTIWVDPLDGTRCGYLLI